MMWWFSKGHMAHFSVSMLCSKCYLIFSILKDGKLGCLNVDCVPGEHLLLQCHQTVITHPFHLLSLLSGWLHSPGSSTPAGPWKCCGAAYQLWHQGQSPPPRTAHRCAKRRYAHRCSAPPEWPQRWCSQQGIQTHWECEIVLWLT